MKLTPGKGVLKFISPLLTLCQRMSYTEPEAVSTPTTENNLYGFYSPSGGTGVSTVVANVAALLANQNLNIAVIDFDLYYPSLFKYLQSDDQEITARLIDIFVTPGARIPEYACATKFPTLNLFTNPLNVDVYDLAQIDYKNIESFLRDVSRLYDYVLVDIRGVYNQETTLAAISQCYRIFTFVRPLNSDAERVLKDLSITMSYLGAPKVKNIVQTMIRDDEFTADEFKNYELNLLENLPYSPLIAKVGANNEIFVTGNFGGDKASALYRSGIKHLAELIVNGDGGDK